MVLKRPILIVALIAIIGPNALADDDLAVKNGDRVVIIGDENGGADDPRGKAVFPVYVESFLISRYPDLKVSFINRSWEGDTARLATMRLERDVFKLKPTVAIICVGMNDAAYLSFSQERLAEFDRHLRELVKQCRDKNMKTWLISPPRVEYEHASRVKVRREGTITLVDLERIAYNDTLAKYADTIAKVAKDTDSGFVDWYQATLDAQQAAELRNESIRLTVDGRIPNPRSQSLLAMRILEAWSAEPITIEIDLDWERSTATVTTHREKQRVVPMEVHEDGRRVLVLEKLPLPWIALALPNGLEPDYRAAQMCRITLRSDNPPQQGLLLTPAITAPPTETFTSEQLTEGVNIASTMLIKKTANLSELNYLIGQKNSYLHFPWRQMELSPPRDRELVKAQQMLLAAYREYADGYETILHNRPKTFDLRLTIRADRTEYRLPTRTPAAGSN